MFNDVSGSYSKNESINKFFYPRSIAVIGASNDINKIGGFIFSQVNSKEDIGKFPINIREESIQGVKAYPRMTAIGQEIDVAIICIPSIHVLQSVEDCANAGCKNIIIISAGFKEVGDEGKEREEKLKEMIKEHSLNVVGPNCLGLINSKNSLNCSFSKNIPPVGGISLVSQSGAVIDALVDWSFKYNIGFSKVVSVGNMAGVDELSMLNYLKDDPETTAIVFYMETLEKGKLFADVLKEVTRKKPVIIIKPGKSQNAKSAIGSHTGSLAQDSVLVETLIRESNGIMVENLNDLFNIMIGLNSKHNSGKNAVIVTNAGGPGVISTDVLENSNFELYKFNDMEKGVFNFLPVEASLNNPIDILGDGKSDRYTKTLEELDKNPNVDYIFVLLTPQIMTDCENIAEGLIWFKGRTDKCVVSSFLGDREIGGAIRKFAESGFPNFTTPSDAISAMDKLRTYRDFSYFEEVPNMNFDNDKIMRVKPKLSGYEGLLTYNLAKEVLESLDLKIAQKKVLKAKEDIKFTIVDVGEEYVLKADGSSLIHKKEVGGVEVGITRDNFNDKATLMWDKVSKVTDNFTLTLEKKVSGVETIIGLKWDLELGNFIMFGTGGTYVNLIKDVNFSSAPLSEKRAENLIKNSKIYEMLKGYRDIKPVDIDKLRDFLIRVSYLQKLFPEIKEVDFNPVMCSEEGIFLVDVKLIL